MDTKNKKLKRLLILPGFYLPHIGGVEIYVDEFSKYLSKKKYEITIFAPNISESGKNKEYELKYNNVKIMRYPAFTLIPRNPLPKFWSPCFLKQIKEIINSKPDIIITHTRFYFSTLLGFFFARLFRKRFVHVEHGSAFLNTGTKALDWLSKTYDLIIGKKIVNNADVIIAVSNVSRKFLIKTLKIKKEVQVVYTGVDFEKYGDITPKDMCEYGDKIHICYFGRLRHWKGVENSIKAIKILGKKYKNKILFIIIGGGEEKEKLKKLAKGEPIIFIGAIPQANGISILKSCDIYIHSSYPGGALSLSLLQAMYCKNAVIATRNEGADEIVINNKTGLFVDTNPEDIKNKLEILINNENLREKLSENSHEFVKQNFSWEVSIGRYIKIFSEII